MSTPTANETAVALGIPGAPFKYHAVSDLIAEYLAVALEERPVVQRYISVPLSDPAYTELEDAADAISNRKDVIARRILDKPTKTFADLMEKAVVAWDYALKLANTQLADCDHKVSDMSARAASLTMLGVLQVASNGPPSIPPDRPEDAPPRLIDLSTPLTALDGAMAVFRCLANDIGAVDHVAPQTVDDATLYVFGCLCSHLAEVRECYDALLAHENDQNLSKTG